MSETISAITGVTPSVTSYTYTQQQVYGAPVFGKDKIVETTYSYILYDRNGYVQKVANTSTVSYFV